MLRNASGCGQIASRHQSATVVYETLRLNLSTAADTDNKTLAGHPVCSNTSPPATSPREFRAMSTILMSVSPQWLITVCHSAIIDFVFSFLRLGCSPTFVDYCVLLISVQFSIRFIHQLRHVCATGLYLIA